MTSLADRRAAYPTRVLREQFGATMLALGAERPDLVALTADLMYPTGMVEFAQAFPERFFNVGIAEQNMTAVAAGLATMDKLPVVCGYAAFTSLRAVEQAKLDCAYNNLRVILVGQSAGLSYSVGGPTHQTFEDVAIMRAIPNMQVVVPSDAIEVDQALRACVAAPGSGPIYVRLGRGPEPVFNQPGQPFILGQAVMIRPGSDVCLIANGPMVFEALLAAHALLDEGISAGVLNIHTVKPIDRSAVIDAARRVKAIVVVEEHNIIGGLGSAVLECLEEGHSCPVKRVGIADCYPPIGPVTELRMALGLSAEHLVTISRDLLHASHGQHPPPTS